MKFDHAHSLGRDEARRRIEKLGEYWRTKYGVSVAWSGDSAHLTGTVKGVKFDATLHIDERRVAAEGTDPGLLMRAVATKYLQGKLAYYLDPTKNIDDLIE